MIYLALLISQLILVVSSKQADYYWRNYNGEIPDDAFQAGWDSNGKPIYIGQGLFMQQSVGLIPGTLYAGSPNIIVTAQVKVFSTNKFVKILCTKHPNNLRWVPVSGYADVSSITNVHLVEGGVETDTVVHIGRALHEGSTQIGKIYKLGPSHVGLYIPNNQGTETKYNKFDLLTYDFNRIDVNCTAGHLSGAVP